MQGKTFHIRLDSEQTVRDEQQLNEFLATVEVKQMFASVESGGLGELFWSVLIFYEPADATTTNSPISTRLDDPLTSEEAELFDTLRDWRQARAQQEGVPPYAVAHNRELHRIIKLPVRQIEDFSQIPGWRERKIRKYGVEILEILREWGHA